MTIPPPEQPHHAPHHDDQHPGDETWERWITSLHDAPDIDPSTAARLGRLLAAGRPS